MEAQEEDDHGCGMGIIGQIGLALVGIGILLLAFVIFRLLG